MKYLHKHTHELFLVIIVLCCIAAMHSCVSAGRVDAHGVKVNAAVDAVNADAGAAQPTRDAIAAVAEDQSDMSGQAHAMVHAATSGDWKTLALQGLVGIIGLGATGVATYKKVNKDRDASSPERTQTDLVNLGLKPGTLEAPKAGV